MREVEGLDEEEECEGCEEGAKMQSGGEGKKRKERIMDGCETMIIREDK